LASINFHNVSSDCFEEYTSYGKVVSDFQNKNVHFLQS